MHIATPLRISLVILTMTFFCGTSSALAQEPSLTPRQTEILKGALRVDGGLTKTQYDEFWADFRTLNPEGRERFRKAFRAEFPALLEYQRTLWLAARESIKQRKPIVTPELQKEFARAEQHDKNNPSGRSRSTKMKQQAQELLEAAAYNSSVIRDGHRYQITPDVVGQILNGLDNSLARLERLLSPSWQPPAGYEK